MNTIKPNLTACIERAAFKPLVLLAVLCFGSAASKGQSNSYSIDWSKVAGGGGTSTNGQYSLSGTIGQYDARTTPMTNGQYSLSGGFWVLPQAVQVEGAPALGIVRAGAAQATISWTPATPGWVLQESLNLTSGWTNSISGTTNPVTVPALPPRKFYRLFKP